MVSGRAVDWSAASLKSQNLRRALLDPTTKTHNGSALFVLFRFVFNFIPPLPVQHLYLALGAALL